MNWHAHVTVATIVEQDGRFLFVEELQSGRLVLNQPAGHLEPGESLQQAALRETLEESACEVELTGVTGIYLYTAPSNGVTYQRVCFNARLIAEHGERQLDSDIHSACWMTHAQLLQQRERLRSMLVLRCLEDYLNGPSFPLELIR
jgi:ADP-ribose pyrophosphatase YjhB (NUDIX family)